MPELTVKVLLQDIKSVETDALVVGFFEDVRPLKGLAGQIDWLLCGTLSRLVIEKKMRGAAGEVALLTSQGKFPAPKIFLVGLGSREGFSPDRVRSAARTAAAAVAGAGVARAAMECFSPHGAPDVDGLPALRAGLSEGAGGRSLLVSLLVQDTAAYDRLSQFLTPLASAPRS